MTGHINGSGDAPAREYRTPRPRHYPVLPGFDLEGIVGRDRSRVPLLSIGA